MIAFEKLRAICQQTKEDADQIGNLTVKDEQEISLISIRLLIR